MSSVHLTPRSTHGGSGLSERLRQFELAHPAQIEERKLLRRVDTKFLFARRRLDGLLQELSKGFSLLRAGTSRVARYDTVYFDTPDLKLFHLHRRGVRPRHKVRVRSYPDRALCFLEIKTKDKRDVTSKVRVARAEGAMTFSMDEVALISQEIGIGAEQLVPQIRLRFPRITLLGNSSEERITLDLGLEIITPTTSVELSDVIIGELKQPHFSSMSPGRLAFRTSHILPERVSKYCSGLGLVRPELSAQVFWPVLRELRRNNHV